MTCRAPRVLIEGSRERDQKSLSPPRATVKSASTAYGHKPACAVTVADERPWRDYHCERSGVLRAEAEAARAPLARLTLSQVVRSREHPDEDRAGHEAAEVRP